MAIDLVTVPGSSKRLERGTAEAYARLVEAARADGIQAPSLEIVSGYRTREEQEKLWNKALQKYGTPDKARIWVAPPGHSQHETGLAVDFNIEGMPFSISGTKEEKEAHLRAMRNTAAHRWLVANARRFGFTPYAVEPWHWAHTMSSIPASSITTTPGSGGAAIIAVLLALWIASGA